MTTLATGQPIPFYALGADVLAEDPKALFSIVDFGAGTQWTGDLLSLMEQRRIKSIRTLYVDLIDCANNVTLLFPQTQQRMILPAGGWGYIPVIVTSQAQFVLTGTGPDVLRVHFLNKDFDPIIYDPLGSVPSGDVLMSASPRLLGRFSAGAGPAEEIALGAPFSIAGGTFTAQAAAQYNIMGRRSAGAGAFEDSTRAQLQLPVLVEANLFQNAAAGSTGVNNEPQYGLGVLPTAGVTASLLFVVDGIAGSNYIGIRYSNDSSSTAFQSRKTRGTRAAPLYVAANDTLASYTAFSWNENLANWNSNIASFNLRAITAHSATNADTYGSFVFTPTGSLVPAEYFRMSPVTGFSMGGANVVIDQNRLLKRRPFTFATLPAAATSQDGEAVITDGAAAPAWLAAAAGGGAVRTPVISNGAVWNNG